MTTAGATAGAAGASVGVSAGRARNGDPQGGRAGGGFGDVLHRLESGAGEGKEAPVANETGAAGSEGKLRAAAWQLRLDSAAGSAAEAQSLPVDADPQLAGSPQGADSNKADAVPTDPSRSQPILDQPTVASVQIDAAVVAVTGKADRSRNASSSGTSEREPSTTSAGNDEADAAAPQRGASDPTIGLVALQAAAVAANGPPPQARPVAREVKSEALAPTGAKGTAKPVGGKPEADPLAEAGPDAAARGLAAVLDDDAAPAKAGATIQPAGSGLPDHPKLTVVRSETHLAPVGQQSPMLQVADRLRTELGSATSTQPAFSDAGAALAKPGFEPAVKVLHIQLEPADLGTVTVRMSLKQDALTLQLDVAQHATAHALQKDHASLTDALRSAGYLLDGVAVQVKEPANAQGSMQSNYSGAQTSSQSAAQSQSDLPNGGAGGGQAQSGHGQQNGGRARPADFDGSADGARRAGAGVYV